MQWVPQKSLPTGVVSLLSAFIQLFSLSCSHLPSLLCSLSWFFSSLDNCKFLAVSPPFLSTFLGDRGQVTASQSFGLRIC